MVKRLFTLIVLLGSMLVASATVRGDINGDGMVDVDDVNAIINITLGKAIADDFEGESDLNSDDMVDIDDLNIIINIMLGKDDGGSYDPSDWVDLGLPSGILWATRNIGASSPEDYGDYFAWGETSPSAIYNTIDGTFHYKWFYSYYNEEDRRWHSGYTKYCTQSKDGLDGFVDNKTELDLADDAAAANWGGGARMPSSDQIEELINTCSWNRVWRNEVAGISIIGPNGKSIFLPCAGFRYGTELGNEFDQACYWSRTLSADDSNGAYSLDFYWGTLRCCDAYPRTYGMNVRAVRVP